MRAEEGRKTRVAGRTRDGGPDDAARDGKARSVLPADRTVVDVELLAAAGAVAEMRHLFAGVAAHAGARREVQEDVAQSVSEAVTNVILHAYPSARPGLVRVWASVAGGGLEIVVRDDGRGFAAGASDGVGVGLTLIAAMTARFRIERRAPRGTDVWMRFHLPA